MRGLERQTFKEIIREMSLVSVKPDVYIFKEGGIGNYFYILKKGEIDYIDSGGKEIRRIKVGESFGELALLHGAPWSQSAKTITECYLWIM